MSGDVRNKISVLCHRSSPNYFLSRWLTAHDLQWARGSQVGGRLDLVRNQTLNRFMQEDVLEGATHLILFDGDMVPIIESNQLLNDDSDFSYLEYPGQNGCEGHRRGRPGGGAMKISKDLIEAMSKPYFHIRLNESKDNMIGCSCDYFANKARELGIEPKCVGNIGHQQGGDGGIIMFVADNKAGYKFGHPHEMPYDLPRSHSKNTSNGTATISAGNQGL